MDSTSSRQQDSKATNPALAVLQENSLNLKEVIDDMFLVLTDKEKDVIIKRFSLNNKPRQTLDKIGKHYSVTRERIRQIENIALNKLRRTVSNTKLRLVNRLAKQFIEEEGAPNFIFRSVSPISMFLLLGFLGLFLGLIFGVFTGTTPFFSDLIKLFPLYLQSLQGKLLGGIVFGLLGGVFGFVILGVVGFLFALIFNGILLFFGGLKIRLDKIS